LALPVEVNVRSKKLAIVLRRRIAIVFIGSIRVIQHEYAFPDQNKGANRVSKLRISLILAVICSGCAALHLTPRGLLKPELKVPVSIAADANQNMPIAFDLVEINDKDLAKDVAKMTAADWFQKRDQIRDDYPKSSSISVMSWEWVPGQVVPDLNIPLRTTPRAVLIFAGYSGPGPHRIRIDPSKPPSLMLGRDNITVENFAK
jgi:type VI secretion system protein